MLYQAAAALFAIVVGSTQGDDVLARQRPWHVEDRGDAFLVVGTPYTKGKLVRFVKSHIFFAKTDAEVLGFGCDGRQILTKAQEAEWRRSMSPKQFDAIFTEAFDWERDGVRDAILALYGGVINTPADAVDYAFVLMRTKPALASIPKGALHATEQDTIWRIATGDGREIMRVSRRSGKMLSGDL